VRPAELLAALARVVLAHEATVRRSERTVIVSRS
jgi:hypothetical protein